MSTQNNPDDVLNNANTSSGSASEGNSATNSGDSMAQGPDPIVNEQEQNKSVNQEEFIDDANTNTEFANDMKDGLPTKDKKDYTVQSVKGDTDEHDTKEKPSMKAD